MSATTAVSLAALSEVEAVQTPGLIVRSVEPELREGPEGPSIYVLVRVEAPSGGGDWDLDASFEVRQAVRRRAAELGISEDVVVVLASADAEEVPVDGAKPAVEGPEAQE